MVMKMRSKFFVAILGILVVWTIGVSFADTSDMLYHPYFVKAYPDPAKPGNVVRLDVDIQNMGSQTVYNISTHLVTTYPFTGIKVDGFIPKLDPMQTATVVYLLNVSKNAYPGQYTLTHKMVYYYGEYNNRTKREWYNKVETVRTIGINVENKKRVEITKLDYSSQVLSGGLGNVLVKIKNTGDVPVNDVIVKLTSKTSYVVAMAPNILYVDTLNPGEERDLNFTYKASSTATTGTYEMNVDVSYDNVDYSMPVMVSVLGYPGIQVSRVSFSNPPEPGKETTMQLCIKNLGAEIDNFYVTLSPMLSTQPTSESLLSQQSGSIAVIGSSSRFFEKLMKDENMCTNFTIAISDNFKEGPATMYVLVRGGNFQQTSIPVGMYVRGIPQLTISDLDYDKEVLTPGTPFKMAIQFENSGTGEAEDVRVVLNNRTVYLGSIDVDDASTASFRLIMNKPGTHKLNVTVYYKDKQGKTYSQSFSVSVFIAKKKSNPWIWIILAVIIILTIGWWYRKVNKK